MCTCNTSCDTPLHVSTCNDVIMRHSNVMYMYTQKPAKVRGSKERGCGSETRSEPHNIHTQH